MQKKLFTKLLLALALTQPAFATAQPANQQCRQNVGKFIQAAYKNAQYLGAKKVDHPEDLVWLNKLEKHAFKTHLGYLPTRAPVFGNGERYGIGTRIQRHDDYLWLVVDVTSDVDGLARTLFVYKAKGGAFKLIGLYFNDHFNDPVYKCAGR